MKFPVIIVTIAFICVYSTEAMEVYFSAANSKTNRKVELDSIRVINSFRKIDTLLIGSTSIVLPDDSGINDLTGNKDKFVTINENIPNVSISFSIRKDSPGSLKISIVNILGQLFYSESIFFEEGNYSFKSNVSSLPAGMYFIMIADGSHSATIKAISTGSYNNSLDIIELNNKVPVNILNPEKIETTDQYTFIGYAKHFYIDTLSKAKPTPEENFLFNMKAISDWKYLFGHLSIGNIKINERRIDHYYGPPDDDSWDTLHFSTNFISSTTIEEVRLPLNYIDYYAPNGKFLQCKDIASKSDTGIFCAETFFMDFTNSAMTDKSISCLSKIVLDSLNSCIPLLTIRIYSFVYHNPMGYDVDFYRCYEEDINSTISLKNLKFTINSEGILKATVKGINVNNYISNILYSRIRKATNCYSYYDDTYVDYVSIDSISDDAYITLELYPQ